MNKKTYVLDTNVLVQSPTALFSFGDNNVVIPEAVIEELDSFKKDKGDKGYCARSVVRYLDSMRERGKLTEGVATDSGGTIKIEMNHSDITLPTNWSSSKADNRILQVCKALQDKGEDVYLITKDTMERIKAEVLDIVAQDFRDEQAPNIDEQYTGRRELFAIGKYIDLFFLQSEINIKEITLFDENGDEFNSSQLTENEFVIVRGIETYKKSAISIFQEGFLKVCKYIDYHPYGITSRNVGQKILVESLMRDVDEAPLVIAKGPAGTAKTFLSLAVGLEKVYTSDTKKKEYRKILVCRPNVHMDEDIGFLPGSEQEKIAPLMRPIYDNLEILIDSSAKERYSDEKELNGKVQYLFEKGVVTTEAVAFLRGRSIVKHWLIIDEAQNLTPKQAKAIITRAGEGTKVILIGDPEQIDHPFLDSRTNGLSYASEYMKGSKLCYQMSFVSEECVRSPLAMEAAKRL